ncbi:MAG: polyphosphate polymerase domain-containing protein [Sedimentisphaerales bacterium]|nr:polyphosphate polymerase domain-containing protein [Sedimentisphaerales bacterium]
MIVNNITGKKEEAYKARGLSARSSDQMLVNRHELKYIISESQAAIIKELIKPHIQIDRYCQVQPDRAYLLTSLYLDSDDLRLCKESLDGCKNRFKLRIRRYSDDPSSPSFFELKRRVNRIIIKNRAKVAHQDIANLLSRPDLLRESENGDGDTLRQFQLYMKNIGARPVVQVRYLREAYEGISDSRIRITFDRKLAYKVSEKAQVSLNGGGWHYYPMEGVILEIKFTEFYPVWLSHIVKSLELSQRSVSKYARTVKHACALRFCAPKIPIKMY